MGVFGGEQLQACPCSKECEEFQKLVELKDGGLVVYFHRPRTDDGCTSSLIRHDEAVGGAVNSSEDVFILYNKKDVKITTSELTSEFEKKNISCPRCRRTFEHAQELMQEVKSIDRKIVIGICNHCRKKSQTTEKPFCACDQIVKKFTFVKGEQTEDTKKYAKILFPPEIGYLRTDAMLKKQKKTHTYSDLQIHLGLSSTSRREPDVQPMFYSHTDLKSDKRKNSEIYRKQAVTFIQPIESHEGVHARIPAPSLEESNISLMETYVEVKELPRPSLKDHKREEIYEDILSVDAKEALKRRHDLSLRQMMRLDKDTGILHSVSKRPEVYETPKMSPWDQMETMSKSHVESKMDLLKIPTPTKTKSKQDPSARDLDDPNRQVQFRSLKTSQRKIQDSNLDTDKKSLKKDERMKDSVDKIGNKTKITRSGETVRSGVKPNFSFSFPKVKEPNDNKTKIGVTSSHLIRDLNEKYRLRSEREKEKLEQAKKKKLAREEKNLLDEQKKRQVLEDKKKQDLQDKKKHAEEQKITTEKDKSKELVVAKKDIEEKPKPKEKGDDGEAKTKKGIQEKPKPKEKGDDGEAKTKKGIQEKPKLKEKTDDGEAKTKKGIEEKPKPKEKTDDGEAKTKKGIQEKPKLKEKGDDGEAKTKKGIQEKPKPKEKGDDGEVKTKTSIQEKPKPKDKGDDGEAKTKKGIKEKPKLKEKTDDGEAKTKKGIEEKPKPKEKTDDGEAKTKKDIGEKPTLKEKGDNEEAKTKQDIEEKPTLKEKGDNEEAESKKDVEEKPTLKEKGDDRETKNSFEDSETKQKEKIKIGKDRKSESTLKKNAKAEHDKKLFEEKRKKEMEAVKKKAVQEKEKQKKDEMSKKENDAASTKEKQETDEPSKKEKQETDVPSKTEKQETDVPSKKAKRTKKTRRDSLDAIKFSKSKPQKSASKEIIALSVIKKEPKQKPSIKDPSKAQKEIVAEFQKLKAERLREKEEIYKAKLKFLNEQQAKEQEKDKQKAKEDEIKMSKIKIKKVNSQEILKSIRILQAANMKPSDIHPKEIKIHKCKHQPSGQRSSFCLLCLDSELELDALSLEMKKNLPKQNTDIIIGENILKFRPRLEKMKLEGVPIFFHKNFVAEPDHRTKEDVQIIPDETKSEHKQILGPVEAKKDTIEVDPGKGIIRYALSDRAFIDKGWTMLPIEKVVRKLNVYRMRPAHPEFDWFEHNKNKRLMTYDTGERLAEFEDNGRGRWYYRSGRLALDYYDAKETNAQQRFVIYSSGEPDERGRTHPITILATFDYLGNGIVFDHAGKTRLKYNQTEGVVLDRAIGPVTHWQWHSLNDPPVLQQVMIDTQISHKDPNILKLGSSSDIKPRTDNDEMLAIEFDNFIREKTKKLSQKFKPFQIKMKAMKINEHFSLKILDQATVYLIYRDGKTNMKINIGMLLDHKEILDTDTAEVGEVSNNLERLPARSDSLAMLQDGVAYAQRYERQRTNRERLLRPQKTCASADILTAATSPPMRLPLITVSTGSLSSPGHCSRIPTDNLYYNTRFLY